MNKLSSKQNLATAVGVALMGSMILGASAQAAENPFGLTELNGGHIQIASNEGKCGEGKCGGDKKSAEGKCGEGKCGGDKKSAEGKCGEGKCGGSK
jgi:uncharacterized low-complexity protein